MSSSHGRSVESFAVFFYLRAIPSNPSLIFEDDSNRKDECSNDDQLYFSVYIDEAFREERKRR